MITKLEYRGYEMKVTPHLPQPVAVYDPRFPYDPALYRTTSLDEAMRWIDAYRVGRKWAVQLHPEF